MRPFSPYPSYKPSRISWLEKIPEKWNILSLKYFISCPVTDGPHETPEFLDAGVPFLSVDSIQEGKLVFENCRYISIEDHKSYSIKCSPSKNDILIGKAASTGKISIVEVDFPFSIWSPLALIKLNLSKVFPKFIYYSLLGKILQYQIDNYCNINTQKNIAMSDLPLLLFLLPPLPEQQRIAAFLDAKTALIDALISKYTRLIELLQEKRSAIINQSTLKGLHPVQMKETGFNWMGQIPHHWGLLLLKYCVLPHSGSIKSGPFGSQLLSSEMQNGDIKVYNQRNVIERNFNAGENYISKEKYEELASFAVLPGDVLLTTRGTIGKCSILPQNAESGILHPCLIRIQPNLKQIFPEFLIYLIQDSYLFQTQLYLMSNATTIDVIYSDTLKRVMIPVPSIDEQKEIVDFLHRELVKLDDFIEKNRMLIQNLHEYRSALITTAVTGQIDLRSYSSSNSASEMGEVPSGGGD